MEAVRTKREAKNEKVMMDTENLYCEMKASILLLSAKFKVETEAATPQQQRNPGTSASLSRVKLPEIKLPVCSGLLHEWVAFRDTFRSLIHDSTQLSAVDKFTYLRSSLTGEALQEVASVEMSAVNYDVAWTTLESRYENKKLIVKAHLDALFAVETMKRENYDGLNRLISAFNKHILMLEKVGQKTVVWSTLLVHMVCSCLGPRVDCVRLSLLKTSMLKNFRRSTQKQPMPSYGSIMWTTIWIVLIASRKR